MLALKAASSRRTPKELNAAIRLNAGIRSLPPPQRGCRAGDPGLLAVLQSVPS
jgi:hypothetical protein